MELRIDQIKIGERKRQDMGDISGLASSIDQIGLLQPIGITPEYDLVFGHRRLLACQQLGWETIEASVIDIQALAVAEHAENEIRKDFTPSERVAIGLAVEAELKAQGERRGGDTSSGEQRNPQNFAECKGKETREIAAQKAGFGNPETYRQAKAVVQNASPELIEAMDNGSIAISTAARLVDALFEVQQRAIADPKQAAELVRRTSATKVKEIRGGAKEERQTATAEKKQERIADIERQAAAIAQGEVSVPTGPFHVISIDPPWPYGTDYDPATRRAANPYPEMSLEQIKAIELPAADDCVLWLWTTHKFMRHSFDLLDAWGFRDVAIVTWVKDRMGLGSWLRSQSEFCIMAVKGKPPICLTNQTTVIHGPLREHSRKPDEFYALVDQLCVGAKLDYFSRQPREGWQQVGNTTELFGEAA